MSAFIVYNYYAIGEDGVLHYEGSGKTIGATRLDLGFLVDGLATRRPSPRDVVEIDGSFLMIDKIGDPRTLQDPSFVEFHYLPFYEDHDHLFGDGPWSPTMIARLRREARGEMT